MGLATIDVDALLDLVEAHRRDAFVDAIGSVATEQGFSAASALLAAVQEEVGRRWQTGAWTVADEHAATAAVDQALTAIAQVAPPAVESDRRLIVTCSEDEWHVLPGRMLTEALCRLGWNTVFLGGSIPADHLRQYLQRHEAHAVAVSCSVSDRLPGAGRTIEACHELGLHVVAGGAGFGDSDRRAKALGADAWAADAAHADEVLRRIDPTSPVAPTPPPHPEVERLQRMSGSVTRSALRVLTSRYAPMLSLDRRQVAQIEDDIAHALRFLESALVVGDDSVLTEFVGWTATIHEALELPVRVLPLSLHAVRDSLPDGLDDARRLLADSAPPLGG